MLEDAPRTPESAPDRLPHLLVCVGPAPSSARLVEAAAGLAAQRGCAWAALFVETVRGDTRQTRARALEHLRLAEHLGATAHTIDAETIAAGTLEFVRTHPIDTVVIGATRRPARHDLAARLRRTLPPGMALHSVLVEPMVRASPRTRLRFDAVAIAVAFVTVVACTAASWMLHGTLAESDLIMLYLLATCLVAFRFSLPASVLTAVSSVAAFDFFFVAPRFTFAVEDAKYLLTFATMAIIGVTIGSLSHRIRERGLRAREQAVRNAALFQLTRRLVEAGDVERIARAGVDTLHDALGCDASLTLVGADGRLAASPDACAGAALDGVAHRFAAQRAVDERRPVDASIGRAPEPEVTCLPLVGAVSVLGVVAVRTRAERNVAEVDLRHLLEIFVQQLATSIERARFAEQARLVAIAAESERMRNALLSSVSHDLRSPLGTIMGAATTVLEGQLEPEAERELLRTIRAESARLERLLANLLELTRLESGRVEPTLEPHMPEEIVGAALHRVRRSVVEAGDRAPQIAVHIAADVDLVPLDGLLIELLLINLVENAIKYGRDTATDHAAHIEIDVACVRNAQGSPPLLRIAVRDHGPGLPAHVATESLFDKFFRAAPQGVGGAGLGLPICRAIARAHDGELRAHDSADGPGAVFEVLLPIARSCDDTADTEAGVEAWYGLSGEPADELR